MDVARRKKKELVWLQILYLYLIPTLLLYFGIVSGDLRVLMLLIISIALYGITKYEKWHRNDWGLKKRWIEDYIPYTLFTIVGVVILILISRFFTHEPLLNWWKNIRFLLLFIPLSVLQEVVFRGVLMHMLRRAFKSPFFIIILNAALFALIHILYVDAKVILPLTFLAGIGFS
ncbi:MAG: CPBP family intramembrane glutamic endopeptidase, partial [Patescibacteria group bacterium]|nr:CPBP family intramembrane glutamic endopeptidase [Patescibacteria group bacterium]